jgi:hypothetical protein
MARIDRQKRALGGAIKRSAPSRAATLIHEIGLAVGRTLDFGCGYGVDAKSFNWEAYDPYYGPPLPEGKFDTIVCLSVLNALSKNKRAQVMTDIQQLLTDEGNAYLAVPRDLPKTGKLGMHHSLQNYVVFTLPSVFCDRKLEIYLLQKNANTFKDRTQEYMSLRDRRRS